MAQTEMIARLSSQIGLFLSAASGRWRQWRGCSAGLDTLCLIGNEIQGYEVLPDAECVDLAERTEVDALGWEVDSGYQATRRIGGQSVMHVAVGPEAPEPTHIGSRLKGP